MMLALTNNMVSKGSMLSAVIAEISHYYTVNVEAGQELTDWMTATFCPQTIYVLLNEVLSNPVLLAQVAARSYHHGNTHHEIWEIVGHGESNAELKKLAYDVPLARAMLTLQVDDCSDEFVLRGEEVFISMVKLYASRQQAGLGE